ncbi:MAG: LamG domain-containing protein, partial [Planctomycetes bacterium]|nr:LamG domain-containing protein [Planctomycetota bacterium]
EIGGRLGRIDVDAAHRDRLSHLRSTIEWLTTYDRAWERWFLGGPVEVALAEAAKARAEGREEDARKAALSAWESVRTSGFGDAIRAYARTLTSQSEFGVLATINVKALVTYRKLLDRIAEFLPDKPLPESIPDTRSESPTPPSVARCTPSTSFAAGTDLPVRAAVVTDGPIDPPVVWYGFGGKTDSREIPMSIEFGATHRAAIPLPAAAHGSAPDWVEGSVQCPLDVDVPGRFSGMPLRLHVALLRFSATIEPRPFARVWKPVAVTPPIAGKDWPVVTRVDLDGPEDGVTVALAVEGGPEIAAEPVPYGSFRAVIPGSAISAPEIRLAARIRRPRGSDVDEVRSPVWTFRTDVRPPAAPANLRLTSPRRYQALLAWDPVEDDSGAVTYEIAKEGGAASETAIPHFLDAKVASGASLAYRVVAIDGAGRRSEPATLAWKAPDWPAPAAPEGLAARDGFGLVTLAWKPVEETVAYRILRAEAEAGPYAAVSGDSPIAASEYVDHPPEAGRAYWWRVVAVDPIGKAGEPSKAVTASAKPVPREPILLADFDSAETTGKLQGGARIGQGKKGKGLDLTAGGWADFPDRIEYDDLVEFTISLWIRPDSLDPMPVFLSHGHFTAEGIFLQFLGHRVRTFLGSGRLTDGGAPATGRWQHIAVVRAGDILTTYLDGKVIARARFAPTPVGARRMPFRIGQYADIAPEFQTRGAIDEVKLWLRPLSEAEIRAQAAE